MMAKHNVKPNPLMERLTERVAGWAIVMLVVAGIAECCFFFGMFMRLLFSGYR